MAAPPAQAWAEELPLDAHAVARLELGAAELEKECAAELENAKVALKSLKKELGWLWPLLRLLAFTLTLIIGGLVLSLLCVIIALLLFVTSAILLLIAATALLLAIPCVLAACFGLIIAPPVLLLSTVFLTKLGRAVSFAEQQIQADVARVTALLEWFEANQDLLLARAVSLARAATPLVKAKLQRFAGVAVKVAPAL